MLVKFMFLTCDLDSHARRITKDKIAIIESDFNSNQPHEIDNFNTWC